MSLSAKLDLHRSAIFSGDISSALMKIRGECYVGMFSHPSTKASLKGSAPVRSRRVNADVGHSLARILLLVVVLKIVLLNFSKLVKGLTTEQ